MASDKKRFNSALSGWETLKREKHFSVPVEEGAVAILCGQRVEVRDDTMTEEEAEAFRIDEPKTLRAEASLLADILRSQDIDVDVVVDPMHCDAKRILTDPRIATIVTIGHGSLSSLFLADGDQLRWEHVSAYADHLKTGQFTQRHCGDFDEGIITVPLGTFAMSRHCDVIAPVGCAFDPSSLGDHDDENNKLVPVTTDMVMTYAYAKANFS